MTEKDLLIQDLRRENETLRKELEWKEKVIELAQRHETIIHEPTKSEFRRMAIQLGYELVVRCKDCKHWKPSGSKAGNSFSDMEYIGGCEFSNYYRRESDFCSYGERKEGGDNGC